MPGFFSALCDLLGIPPSPGTLRHREAMHRCIRERNQELAKPAEQRDAARLLQLTMRVLTKRLEFSQVSWAAELPAGVLSCRCCRRWRLLLRSFGRVLRLPTMVPPHAAGPGGAAAVRCRLDRP